MRHFLLAPLFLAVSTIASFAQPPPPYFITLERGRLLLALHGGDRSACFDAAVCVASDVALRRCDKGDEWLQWLATRCDRVAIPVLRQALDGDEETRRVRAAIALVHCGAPVPAALPLALAALESGDPRIELPALAALVRGDTTMEAALKTARKLVNSPETETRTAVLTTLAESADSLRDTPRWGPAAVGFLLECLAAEDPAVRLHAARGLLRTACESSDEESGKPTSTQAALAALQALAALVGEEHAETRRQAFESLCHASAPLSAITAGLQNPDARIREQAGWHLWDEGDRAREAGPALIKALEDPDARVRTAAAAALVRLGVRPLPRSVPRILLESQKEPDEVARHLAESSLLEISPSAVSDAVEVLSSSSHVRVRTAAAMVIACVDASELPEEDTTAALAGLVGAIEDDESPALRTAAIRALGGFRHEAPAVLAALSRLVAETRVDEETLRWVGNALYRLDTGREVPALLRPLLGGAEPAAAQALVVLTEMQDRPLESFPVLLDAARQADPAVRKRALRLIQRVARSYTNRAGSALPVLLSMLRDPDPQVQMLVMEGLAAFGEAAADATPALIELLQSEDPGLQTHAAWVLGRIGPKARPAVPRLIERSEHGDADCRRAVVHALGDCGGTEALDAVAARLKDPDPTVRRAAVCVLRENDASRFVPALVEALGDSDPQVRREVVEVLGSAGRAAHLALAFLRRILEDDREDIFLRQAAFLLLRQIERGGS